MPSTQEVKYVLKIKMEKRQWKRVAYQKKESPQVLLRQNSLEG